MVKLLILCTAVSAVASAAGFSLTIGPPVAVGPGVKVTKTRAPIFAIRLDNCADPASAKVTAAARAADRNRTEVPVLVLGAGSPGIYLLSQDGPAAVTGPWVVSISASCGRDIAGAIVQVLNQKFDRDSIKLLSRAPSDAEVQHALSDAEKSAIVRP